MTQERLCAAAGLFPYASLRGLQQPHLINKVSISGALVQRLPRGNYIQGISNSLILWKPRLEKPKTPVLFSSPYHTQRVNMDEEDMDPELRTAIASSLRDLHEPTEEHRSASNRQKDVVDLTAESDDEVVEVYPKSKSVVESETEDEEDEELKRAIGLSMQGTSGDDVDIASNKAVEMSRRDEKDHKQTKPVGRKSEKEPSPEQKTEQRLQNQKPSQSMGILGLDRKKMEEERLARLAKRKPEEPVSTDQRESKQLRKESPKATAPSSASQTGNNQNGSNKQQSNNTNQPTTRPSVQFPSGVVKKTWHRNSPRKGDDIKIEEVFQAENLQLAVLSSFMWDMEWLFTKLNTRSSRFLLTMQAKEESTRRQYEAETASMSNLRLCFPPMEGQVNCMHSKLMLLFHPDYVRIVVPTANLTPFDWGVVGGALENSVFLIDLRRKPNSSENPKTAFYEELVYFLKASTLHENVIKKLDSFDFSQTAHIAFVHTIGGTHVGESWRRTGYCGMGRAVNSLGLRTSSPINIDYVTSSIGSLSDEFLRTIYLAAQGDDGLTEYTHRATKSKSKSNRQTTDEWKENRFRVYFPSEDTVGKSYGGPNSAGTICFQSNWYEGPKFPRDVLRDCQSVRGRTLMHNKLLYVRPDQPVTLSDTNKRCPAWAYLGSANLSESAWGRLVQDRTTKSPKLNCRNWECGVIVPVLPEGEDATSQSEGKGKAPEEGDVDAESPTSLGIFKDTIPVPMVSPGRKYADGGLKPWYFMESF